MSRVPMVLRALGVLCLLLAQDWVAAQPGDGRAGQALYRDGLLTSGEPVRATAQVGVQLSGAAAACVNCHRRSGLGGSEGRNNIRPIAGRLLLASSQSEIARRWGVPAGGAAMRPAYDRSSLGRALREGVDPAGRVLDPLMPRYALSDDEVAELHTYLEGLLPAAVAGVTEREIHFSTIIAPGVHPARRNAMLDVLHTFFRDKNGGTRKEARRREVATEQMYLPYRTWVLHVWELNGAPETWRGQLDAYYRMQPVFAVIGGLGSGSWQPVHAFCEGVGLPCVFPDVDDPVDDGAGYYVLYYSRGIALEADVLAKHVAQTHLGKGPIVQVFRDNERGRVPAIAMRDALRRRSIETIADHPVADGRPLSAEFWTQLLGAARPGILILWLDAADVLSLAAMGEPPAGLQTAYVSARLSALQQAGVLPDSWLERLRLVDLFETPDNRDRHLSRMNAWLRARQVPMTDPRTQANAYFAATIAGDAMSSLGENLSRDYFIERIEQMAGSSPSPSIYPRLSLGPGQRFASRGGYILGFPKGVAGIPMSVTDWLIP
jgi:hypothetical protein